MHRPSPRLIRAIVALLLGALPCVASAAPGAGSPLVTTLADTVRLSVVPTPPAADAGDTVLVELTVPVAGPAFNAYDAYLAYDPAVLQFLPAANVSTQEGPLMTTACGLRFHVFEADTLAGRLRVSHSLMCSGRSVTGPGVLYRVKFRCRDTDADTPLVLLVTSPYKTEFYFAGMIVSPLVTAAAVVHVGAGSPTAAPLPAASRLGELRAAPNPFNPRTTISFTGDVSGTIEVAVYAVDGRLVRALWQGRVEGGAWRGEWDGRDDAGRAVAAGAYLVRARGAGGEAVTRVSLVR